MSRARTDSSILVGIYNGARQVIDPPLEILFRVIDGEQNKVTDKYIKTSSLSVEIPEIFDSPRDWYTITAFVSGYRQIGYRPVKAQRGKVVNLDLMLVSDNPKFDFSLAPWDVMKIQFPFLLSGAADEAAGRARYEQLMTFRQKSLVSFLNLTTAMAQIPLQDGNPNLYIKQLIWDKSFAQDRFFAYCDPKLKDQVKAAAAEGLFAEETNPANFHSGATASWKQTQFDLANVQLTFHENPPDQKVIDDVNCVTLEPDIDYFKDILTHGLVEVIPNAITGGLTDPTTVYVLRWMVGQLNGGQEFEPQYTIG